MFPSDAFYLIVSLDFNLHTRRNYAVLNPRVNGDSFVYKLTTNFSTTALRDISLSLSMQYVPRRLWRMSRISRIGQPIAQRRLVLGLRTVAKDSILFNRTTAHSCQVGHHHDFTFVRCPPSSVFSPPSYGASRQRNPACMNPYHGATLVQSFSLEVLKHAKRLAGPPNLGCCYLSNYSIQQNTRIIPMAVWRCSISASAVINGGQRHTVLEALHLKP